LPQQALLHMNELLIGCALQSRLDVLWPIKFRVKSESRVNQVEAKAYFYIIKHTHMQFQTPDDFILDMRFCGTDK